MLLLAAVAGLYVWAPLAVLLETAWTRAFAALSRTSLLPVTSVAAYTVDPFIEETLKLAPLLCVWLLVGSVRRQWGMTDFVLVRAALGTGFGLAEDLLRFPNDAARAIALPGGGWLIPVSLSAPTVPGPMQIVRTWLPAGVGSSGLFGGAPADTINIHLVWSAVADLGLALLLQGRRPRSRLVGVLLVAYAGGDHAAYNTRLAPPAAQALATPMGMLRNLVWAYPLASLAVAVWLDRADMAQVDRAQPRALLACERRGPVPAVGLVSLAVARLPWSLAAVWGFVRLHRAYLLSGRRGGPDNGLRSAVDTFGAALDRASGSQGLAIWQRVSHRVPIALPCAWPRWTEMRSRLRTRRGLLALVRLLVVLPPLLYFVVGTIPPLAGVQRLVAAPVVFWWVLGAGLIAAAWTVAALAFELRRLPTLLKHPAAEVPATATLGLLGRAGALAILAVCFAQLAAGHAPGERLLPLAHILDAAGQALLIAGVLLALVAMATFPPFSLAALVGGGTVLVWTGLSSAAVEELVIAGVVGSTGIALMQASEGGGGSGGSTRGGDGDDPPLANAEEASIDPSKFERYSMDRANPQNEGKAEGFAKLGYDVQTAAGRQTAAEDVIRQLRSQLPHTPARLGSATEWGQRFQVRTTIQGPNGRQGTLVTQWQYDVGSDVPRLITNWVETW